jgi:uncharacterized protein (TIGR00269 family)
MIKCSLCGKEAVVELKYNGFSLCEGCFIKQFEKRVRRVLRLTGFFKRGNRIVVGVSGGKDSSAVLSVLNKFNSKVGCVLIPVLIDEGIKGYRNKARRKAEKLCSELGLELNVYSFKELFGFSLDEVMSLNPKRDACAYCGVWRRWALNKAALDLKADFVVVGHNADDMAQSFLMNLLRNNFLTLSRSGGLKAGVKRELFATRVKPLVFNLEKESAIYCFLKNIPFYLGECPYYTGFRMKIKDFLNDVERSYPGSKFALSNASLSIQKSLPADNRKIMECSSCGFYSSTSKCMACALKGEVEGLT